MPEHKDNSSKVYGITGTVILHVAVLVMLWLIKIGVTDIRDDEDGGGIYVLSGAGGSEWNYTESLPADVLESGTEENITQDLDESISLDNADDEKRKQEEAEKAARERAQAEAIDNLISGALNKNNSDNGSGGKDLGGSGDSDKGALNGHPGYGSFDLGGRGLRQGERLPVPQYDNSNDEGVIVVAITVDAYGKVIQAQVSPVGSSGTAYSNGTLRKRAVESAKKALFEKSDYKSNQQGTITYRFVQRN